jgi:hypothetical protein
MSTGGDTTMDGSGPQTATGNVREWKLQPQSEYRFEIDSKRPIAIQVRCVPQSRLPAILHHFTSFKSSQSHISPRIGALSFLFEYSGASYTVLYYSHSCTPCSSHSRSLSLRSSLLRGRTSWAV